MQRASLVIAVLGLCIFGLVPVIGEYALSGCALLVVGAIVGEIHHWLNERRNPQ